MVDIVDTENKAAARRESIIHAGLFCVGIIVLFTGLGWLAKAIAGPFGVVLLGSNPWVNGFITAVFVVFGLSLLGAFELTLPSGLLTRLNSASGQGGYAGTLIMGLTFKENCPDLRNTRVVDIILELSGYNVSIDIYDPWVTSEEAEHEYGLKLIAAPQPAAYDAIVLAVAHHQFGEMGAAPIRGFGKKEHVLYDLKYILPPHEADLRL